MKSRTPEYVRGRIEWRAKKQGMPFKNTGFWSGAPLALKQVLPASVTSPVVFTMSDRGEATIIGTDEVFVISKQGDVRIQLDRVEGVTSPCVRQGKQKSESDTLELLVAGGSRHQLPTEKGKACFAFWNILLMLARMNGKGEPDGPANRSQPIRAETNRTSAAAGSDR
jgi:hypothetical protein